MGTRRLGQATLSQAVHAGDEVLTWGEISPEFKGHLEQDNAVSRLVSGIILLIVMLGVASAQLAAVLERRREFAVLSALGMRSRTIVAVLLQEALAIGIASAALGLVLGCRSCGSWPRRHRSEPVYGRELQLQGVLIEPVIYGDVGAWTAWYVLTVAIVVTVIARCIRHGLRRGQSRRRITGGVMSKPILVARGVTKVFELGRQEVRALRESTSKCEGEFLALVGPSGSGKTTLLNLVGHWTCPHPAICECSVSRSRRSLDASARICACGRSGSCSRRSISCPC